LGDSPVSEFYVPTFRNTLSAPSSWVVSAPPMRMEQCVPKRRHKIHTSGNHPKERIKLITFIDFVIKLFIRSPYNAISNLKRHRHPTKTHLKFSTVTGKSNNNSVGTAIRLQTGQPKNGSIPLGVRHSPHQRTQLATGHTQPIIQ